MGLTVSTRGCLLLTVAIPVTGRVCGSTWSPANLFPTGTEEGLFLDFSDISTLYTDQTFATNISAIGDPVGGVLDKSQGGVPGPELVTNGDFASADGWMVSGGWSIADGKLTNDGTNDWQTTQNIGATEGALYLVTLTSSGRTTGQCQVAIGDPFASVRITISANGNYEKYCVAGASTAQLSFYPQSGFDGSIEIISVKKLPGNHLIQSTSTARPIWTRHPKSGVRNLVDASEDASIFQFNSGNTITTDTDISPVGTLTADTIAPSGNSWVRKAISIPADGETYTGSIYLKKRAATGLCRVQLLTETGGTVVSQNIDVNLSTGAVTGGSAEDVGDYYRISGQITNNSANTSFKFFVFPDTSGSLAPVVCWGWSIELGSSATTYQTRVSQYDVTEAGVDDCYGLTFDGVDDYMVTAANLDLSGTDEITLVFGEYNNSNVAAAKRVFDFGGTSNVGNFQVYSPFTPGVEERAFATATGTTTSFRATALRSIPSYGVISAHADQSTPTRTIRADGADVDTVAGGAVGNFGSYALSVGSSFIGAAQFTGTVYGVTLTDYILDAEQLAALETWTAARTPEVTLA